MKNKTTKKKKEKRLILSEYRFKRIRLNQLRLREITKQLKEGGKNEHRR
jgi:hypothetical protein